MKNYWKTLKNKINNWRYAPLTNPSEIYDKSDILKRKLQGKVKSRSGLVIFFGIDEVEN
jgi:hypothetical protein